ncbi:cytochrome P450 [Infundibulicybe gibba]|nr:cytochrome P450 [Infundibulicybe gibba]
MAILLLESLSATILIYGLGQLFAFAYREVVSPLKNLPGPKSESYQLSNGLTPRVSAITWQEDSVPFEEWIGQYGPTFQYRGLFGTRQLFTMDTRALNYILANNYTYQKSDLARSSLSQMLGPGLVVVEEDQHKLQLRDHWAHEITEQGEKGRIDALSGLSRTALDVIGLAGFHYDFNASAFETIFKAGTDLEIFLLLRAIVPLFRAIPHKPNKRDREMKAAKDTMNRIGEQLIRESRQAMSDTSGGGRDLLSLLLRANTSAGSSEQRMSDLDILAQVPTFLVAGHETTSLARGPWALYALTQNMEIQNKLRTELWTVPSDNPTMEELNSLPYLDAVVRETMRVHTPISATVRVAMKDDIVPLGEPYRGRDGKLYHESHSGQNIVIPILVVNRAQSIWGEDAREFRNMLTFLGGPRACIGYRFSIVEIKALLFTLVRAFEFELAIPAKDLTKRTVLTQRPVVLTDPKNSNQMPLLIRPYQHASNTTDGGE